MRSNEPLAVGPLLSRGGDFGLKLVEQFALEQEMRLHYDPSPPLRGDLRECRLQPRLRHREKASYC